MTLPLAALKPLASFPSAPGHTSSGPRLATRICVPDLSGSRFSLAGSHRLLVHGPPCRLSARVGFSGPNLSLGFQTPQASRRLFKCSRNEASSDSLHRPPSPHPPRPGSQACPCSVPLAGLGADPEGVPATPAPTRPRPSCASSLQNPARVQPPGPGATAPPRVLIQLLPNLSTERTVPTTQAVRENSDTVSPPCPSPQCFPVRRRERPVRL